jgi:predicted Zn-ribbon and HTH transcriptional regulator
MRDENLWIIFAIVIFLAVIALVVALGDWLNRVAIRADIAANRPLLDERLLSVVRPGDTVVVVAEMLGASRVDADRIQDACKAMAAQLDARGIEVVLIPQYCKNVATLTRLSKSSPTT